MKLNEFYTANDVVDAVYLSRFVYKNKDKIVEKFDDLELYSFHDIKDTEFACYKQEGTNHFFIAFRGSSSLNDWIADAKFKSDYFFNTKAHRGFIKHYNKGQSQLKELVSKIRDYDNNTTIFFVGHSLGGALVYVAYYEFCLKAEEYGMNGIEFRLITFGCPKVFRRKYISNIHSMFFNNTIRITNGDDLVTKLPPDILFLKNSEYIHFGQHIGIGEFDYRGFLREHRMPKYINYVEQVINKEV